MLSAWFTCQVIKESLGTKLRTHTLFRDGQLWKGIQRDARGWRKLQLNDLGANVSHGRIRMLLDSRLSFGSTWYEQPRSTHPFRTPLSQH